jgi:hypothetical protein
MMRNIIAACLCMAMVGIAVANVKKRAEQGLAQWIFRQECACIG